MDKSLFLEVDNKRFETDVLVYKYITPFKGVDQEVFGRNVQREFISILNYHGVDANKHIEGISITWGSDEEGNHLNCLVNVKLRNGRESVIYIHNKIGIFQTLLANGRMTQLEWNEWKEWFYIYNINEDFDENKKGLFLFTITIENTDDSATYATQYPHNILRFDIVTENNKEVISYAKQNGALHFFYTDLYSQYEIKKIIERIKEDSAYKKQREKFPEMIIE